MSKIPEPRSANDKYGIYDIAIGKHKDFSLERKSKSDAEKLYNNIRLSAWYYGKTYDRNYITRKMKDEKGKSVVSVYREKLETKK